MNWDRIAGNWKQAKGKLKEQWGKLTDDDLDKIAGKRDQLVGKIQNSYGIGKDEAEKQLNEWNRAAPVDAGGVFASGSGVRTRISPLPGFGS